MSFIIIETRAVEKREISTHEEHSSLAKFSFSLRPFNNKLNSKRGWKRHSWVGFSPTHYFLYTQPQKETIHPHKVSNSIRNQDFNEIEIINTAVFTCSRIFPLKSCNHFNYDSLFLTKKSHNYFSYDFSNKLKYVLKFFMDHLAMKSFSWWSNFLGIFWMIRL